LVASAQELKARVEPSVVEAALKKVGGQAEWVAASKEDLRAFIRATPLAEELRLPASQRPALPDALGFVLAEAREVDAVRARRLRELNGLKLDLADQGAVRQVLRKGVRIETVTRVAPNFAWVLLVGRNLDSSEYRFSEAWGLREGKWRQHWPPRDQDLRWLPKDFAPPLDLPIEVRSKLKLRLLAQLYDLGKPTAPLEPLSGVLGCGSR
ncbi:MAG: hypothetical protein H6Q89_4045, partial [Myxococcaceae bacterium]|nr:hypothetical protein [Myxococcaceae bacterium]